MLASLIALAAITPVTYSFPNDQKRMYDVTIVFDGVIPFGVEEPNKVQVDLGVRVQGAGKESVSSELISLKLLLNGGEMPFGVDQVKEFFPKTTIKLTPQGKVLATDAPNKEIPVRLPGLDVKRFPDFTYLPIEFPMEGVEVNKPFKFQKRFGDSDAQYTVTPTAIDKGLLEMDLTVAQDYETLENESMEVVAKAEDAIKRVTTQVRGTGKATFDLKAGVITTYRVEAQALSNVIDLSTKAKSERRLKTLLSLKLRK